MLQQQQRLKPAIFAALMFAVACQFLGANSYSVNQFGDVLIRHDGENFQCDRITCPPGSVSCQVIKSPDDTDSRFMVRRNICYGRNREILLQSSSREQLAQRHMEDLNVIVNDDGYSSSSSVISNGAGQNYYDTNSIDGEALQHSIQDGVQRTLDEVSRNLDQSLGGLWRGFK